MAVWHFFSCLPFTQAKFELVTSEASYIRSLTIAVDHFMLSQELSECLGAQEKQWLFSKLPEVKDVSERWSEMLLASLTTSAFTPHLSSLPLLTIFSASLKVSAGPGAQTGGGYSPFWCVWHCLGSLPGSEESLLTLCNQPGLPGTDVSAFTVSRTAGAHQSYNQSWSYLIIKQAEINKCRNMHSYLNVDIFIAAVA